MQSFIKTKSGSTDIAERLNNNSRTAFAKMLGYAGYAVNMISNSVAAVELYWAEKQVDGSLKRVEKHWMVDLFNSPNFLSMQTMKDILNLTQQNKEIHGNTYIWAAKKTRDKVIDMTVLPSKSVQVMPSRSNIGAVGSYMYNGKVIPTDEMIHLRTFFASNDLEKQTIVGTPGIINNLKQIILMDNEIVRFVNYFFQNDAIPALIGSSRESGMSQEYWDRNKIELKKELPGKTFVFLDNGDLKPLESGVEKGIASNIADTSLDAMVRTRVTTAFNIPEPIFTGKDANKATAVVANERYYHDVLLPRIQAIEATFTLFFKTFYKSNFILTHDAKTFETPENRNARIKTDIETGISTRNEIRLNEGKPPIKNGDDALISSNLRTVDSLYEQPEPAASKKKSFSVKSWVDLSEKEKKIAWKSFDNVAQAGSKGIRTDVVKVFDKLEKEIVKNTSASLLKSATIYRIKADNEAEDELFDIEKWQKIALAGTLAAREANSEAAIVAAMELVPDSIDDIDDILSIITKSVDASSDKITVSINTIDKDLKDDIRKILRDNPTGTAKELLELINDNTKDKFSRVYTKSRANTIANTTAGNITNSSADFTYTKLGYKLRWLSRRDGKVRRSHLKVDGQKRGSDGFFRVGKDKMPYPTAGSIAKENVKCRCYVVPDT